MIIKYKVPFKYIFRKIWVVLLLVVVFSSLSYILSIYFELLVIPVGIPAFLGTAISLVLGFRLAQSYDRWWESRKVWGSIVNDSRTLVIQLLNFSKGETSNDKRSVVERIALRQIGWCYSLGQSLRKQNATENLGSLISTEEFDSLERNNNIPLALVNKHAKDIAKLHFDSDLNDYQHIQLSKTLEKLVDAMGMAERIKSTIFPITYRIYLHLFIYIFLGLLSISLAEIGGVWQILIVTLISLPFLLLERLAYLMQDPFENRPTDTAVTTIARTIEINIRQLLDNIEVPLPLEPEEDYYLL